jgi:Protein of unknown function (DUF664)
VAFVGRLPVSKDRAEEVAMSSTDVLIDGFERIRDAVYPAVTGLSLEELTARLDPESNTIAWLVWHLTRIEDDHLAAITGQEQVWTSSGWAGRFALPLDDADTGYGHDPATVALVVAGPDLLLGYFEEVHQSTVGFVEALGDADLERVVDDRWDPPVLMGIRLVSVIADGLQHSGQAAFVRGIVQRR